MFREATALSVFGIIECGQSISLPTSWEVLKGITLPRIVYV